MQLSDKEKKIISSVHLQANAPVAQIAQETGLRSHVVRYTLNRLKEQGILTPMVCIDPYALGLDYYGAYFSYLCQSDKDREKLLALLLKSPEIALASEYAGEFQYHAAAFVSKVEDMDHVFGRIAKLCKGQFLNKVLATRVRWSVFQHKFLAAHESAVSSYHFGRKQSKHKAFALDEEDRKILSQLTSSPQPPIMSIARALELPRATIEYRIKRLEDAGVIVGYMYIVPFAKCGLYSWRLLLWQKHSSEEFCQSLFSFAASHPNIKTIAHCLGNWDYEIRFVSENPEELPSLVQSVYSRFSDQIASSKLLTYVRRHKFCMYPF